MIHRSTLRCTVSSYMQTTKMQMVMQPANRRRHPDQSWACLFQVLCLDPSGNPQLGHHFPFRVRLASALVASTQAFRAGLRSARKREWAPCSLFCWADGYRRKGMHFGVLATATVQKWITRDSLDTGFTHALTSLHCSKRIVGPFVQGTQVPRWNLQGNGIAPFRPWKTAKAVMRDPYSRVWRQAVTTGCDIGARSKQLLTSTGRYWLAGVSYEEHKSSQVSVLALKTPAVFH
mmetsp:Transcript_111460/g.193193  ORF Transcript_111460/g.193193 Transcript_111460/m.193193 type:complete len:233 (-) Transcript_111460:45-743(-)